jgi:hypothetical protein
VVLCVSISTRVATQWSISHMTTVAVIIVFSDFAIYLQSVEIHSANGMLGSEGE